jgi:hypothetical protein
MQQLFQSCGYFAYENPFSVFGYPYQVNAQSMFCMGSCPISGHNRLCQKTPPLRYRFAPGDQKTPGLKTWGFLVVSIKWELCLQLLKVNFFETDLGESNGLNIHAVT